MPGRHAHDACPEYERGGPPGRTAAFDGEAPY